MKTKIIIGLLVIALWASAIYGYLLYTAPELITPEFTKIYVWIREPYQGSVMTITDQFGKKQLGVIILSAESPREDLEIEGSINETVCIRIHIPGRNQDVSYNFRMSPGDSTPPPPQSYFDFTPEPEVRRINLSISDIGPDDKKIPVLCQTHMNDYEQPYCVAPLEYPTREAQETAWRLQMSLRPQKDKW